MGGVVCHGDPAMNLPGRLVALLVALAQRVLIEEPFAEIVPHLRFAKLPFVLPVGRRFVTGFPVDGVECSGLLRNSLSMIPGVDFGIVRGGECPFC